MCMIQKTHQIVEPLACKDVARLKEKYTHKEVWSFESRGGGLVTLCPSLLTMYLPLKLIPLDPHVKQQSESPPPNQSAYLHHTKSLVPSITQLSQISIIWYLVSDPMCLCACVCARIIAHSRSIYIIVRNEHEIQLHIAYISINSVRMLNDHEIH